MSHRGEQANPRQHLHYEHLGPLVPVAPLHALQASANTSGQNLTTLDTDAPPSVTEQTFTTLAGLTPSGTQVDRAAFLAPLFNVAGTVVAITKRCGGFYL